MNSDYHYVLEFKYDNDEKWYPDANEKEYLVLAVAINAAVSASKFDMTTKVRVVKNSIAVVWQGGE